MNSIKQLRLLGLFASAAAIAAFGMPSTALAGKSHHLNPYKVEEHVELEGEDASYDVQCQSGDIAVDGMWRIDNVDQDNDWEDPNPALAAYWAPTTNVPPGIGTSPDLVIRKSVRPMGSYALPGDTRTYRFEFTPLGGADVQIKLWVICIPNPATGFGHSHNWRFIEDGSTQHSIPVPALTTDPALALPTLGSCPAKTVLIQPGYQTAFTNHHLVYSRPYPVSPNPWTGRQWGWKVFDDDGTGGSATATWRCLDVKSSGPLPTPNVGHTHKLVFNKKETTFDGSTAQLPKMGPQQVGERQQHCGEHYKALLGGYDITAGWKAASLGPPAAPIHMALYFLGMDPRIKTRAFSFLNLDNTSHNVTVATVCFKDRTT
jgi:hypothetical protein